MIASFFYHYGANRNLFVFIGKRGISKEGGTLNFQLGTEKFSGKK